MQALGLTLRGDVARVAVLAVDPTSPFSGGALLGARVRMAALTAEGAFVRSMATRGALGGLTAATADALDILQAAPFDWIVVETVGVGQDEVDVAGEVDTVCVVTVPGLGDDVQAVKAGLYEVADLFVVNKADTGLAEEVATVLEAMLEVAPPGLWRVPVLRVSARDGDGVGLLLEAVREHQAFLGRDGRRAGLRRQRALRRLERVVGAMAWGGVRAGGAGALDTKDDLLAGRRPRPKGGLTVRDLCNRFLDAKRKRVDSGELAEITWDSYRATCKLMAKWLSDHDGLFGFRPPQAGAICFARYGFTANSTEFVERLIREKSVLLVPGDHFETDGYLRFGYGPEKGYLPRALGLIDKTLKKIVLS